MRNVISWQKITRIFTADQRRHLQIWRVEIRIPSLQAVPIIFIRKIGWLAFYRKRSDYLTNMNTGEEGLLTPPLLSVTVRLNARVIGACGAINTGLAVLGNAPTLGPDV